MNNLRNDLFENFTELKKSKVNYGIDVMNEDTKCCFRQDIEMQLLADIADKAENLKNTNEDLDDLHECIVRTDTKYLNYIKRIEMNMFLESKRRMKTKRLEMSPEKKMNKSNSIEIEDEGEGVDINNAKDCDHKRSQIKTENKHKDQDENIGNNKKKREERGKIRKSAKPLDDSFNLKDLRKNLHDDTNSTLDEIVDKSAFLQQVNLIQRKVLRSSIESKKTVDKCFDFLSKSDYLLKPIKSGRKRPKITSDLNALNLEQESLDLQEKTNDNRELSDESISDQNVNYV